MDSLPAEVRNLCQSAVEAMRNAYCPYSKFQVGAALMCRDGTVITGCNVENAVYGLTICAERVAMVKAVSQGHSEFRAIAVTTSQPPSTKPPCPPCGSCRQFMIEFGKFQVYLFNNDMSGNIKEISTTDLLPLAFTPKVLKDATN